MPLPKSAKLLDWLIDLSDRVNNVTRAALRKPGAGRVVQEGAYGVPTVSADKEAEQAIIDALSEAPIPLNLFSEEVGWVKTKGAEWTLIADPIDGTRNAIRGIPFFCTCLAIGKTGLSDLELGLVRDANTDQVYQATRGGGAFLDGERIRIRPFDESSIIVAAALDYERKLDIQWRPQIHFRDMGSSALELCLVATGGIDLFLSTKPYLRVVDVASATLILREAGGEALDLSRKPLNAGLDLKERIAMIGLGDRRVLKVLP
jgi:fructose-1,6-bisphosphatase/inositol monophosphatase family enzyme